MLQQGDLVSHFDVTTLQDRNVRYSTWQRRTSC